MRPYQAEGRDFLLEHRRAILAYEMGLGKTPTAIMTLAALERPDTLVLCPKVALGVWEDEFAAWEPGTTVITWTGTPKRREKLWDEFLQTPKPRVLLTNLDKAGMLGHKRWPAVIIDEAHKLRNRKTNMFKNVSRYRSNYLFLLTGSPVVNTPGDLWTLLNLISPGEFRSYWKFVNEHCNVNVITVNGQGRTVRMVAGPKNPPVLRNFLAPYLIRKEKAVVLTELPPKIRQGVPLTMNPAQWRIYDDIAEEMMAVLNDTPGQETLLLTPTKLAQLTRLRQLLVNPALVGGPNDSAAFDALYEDVETEFESRNPVIVYTPFVQAIPLLQELLKPLVEFETVIRGGLTGTMVRNNVQAFQQAQTPRKVIYCSLLAGTSWTATEASVGYFLGYDWNPQNNFQAEDRMHRFGQRNAVRLRYYQHRNTIDEHIMKILDQKVTWAELTLSARELLFGQAGAKQTPAQRRGR